jgi:hypothetical protein
MTNEDGTPERAQRFDAQPPTLTNEPGEDGLERFAGDRDKMITASISAGTEPVCHRPRVCPSYWQAIKSGASRRGVQPSDELASILERYAAGRRRGPGKRAEQYNAIEQLMRHVTLHLIRYEGALDAFLQRLSGPAGLAAAEREDLLDSVVRIVLNENRALRKDIDSVRQTLAPNPKNRREQ